MSAIATNHAVIEGIINLAVGVKPDIQWVDEPFTIESLATSIRADQLVVPISRSIEGREVRMRVAVAAQAAIAASNANLKDWPNVQPARKAAALLEMGAAVKSMISRLSMTEKSLCDLVVELVTHAFVGSDVDTENTTGPSLKLLLVYLCTMGTVMHDGQKCQEGVTEDKTELQNSLSKSVALLTAAFPEFDAISNCLSMELADCKSSADYAKLALKLFPESTSIGESGAGGEVNMHQRPTSKGDLPGDEECHPQDRQAKRTAENPDQVPGNLDTRQGSAIGQDEKGQECENPTSVSDKAPSVDSNVEVVSANSKNLDENSQSSLTTTPQGESVVSEKAQEQGSNTAEPVKIAVIEDRTKIEPDDGNGTKVNDYVLVLSEADASEEVFEETTYIGLGAGGNENAAPLPPPSCSVHSAVDGRLIIAMQKALQDRKIKNVGLTLAGSRVDAQRLWRLPALGDARVFRKPNPRAGVSASIEVLLDRSKSMDLVIQLACRITLALAEGFKRVPGTKTAIDLFPGTGSRPMNLLPFGGQVNRARDQVSSIKATGSTPLAQAVRGIMPTLLQQKTERKILLIVSDGKPNDVKDAMAAINSCIAEGIEVLGIGLGPQGRELEGLVQHSVLVNSIDGLPSAFTSLFSGQILKA
jgi:hypothetical protein